MSSRLNTCREWRIPENNVRDFVIFSYSIIKQVTTQTHTPVVMYCFLQFKNQTWKPFESY